MISGGEAVGHVVDAMRSDEDDEGGERRQSTVLHGC
jgi:hypothetical protein